MWSEVGQSQSHLHTLRQHQIEVRTPGQGLHEVTDAIASCVDPDMHLGICSVLVQHTSASLVIQENADPSARHDLEAWLCRLAPEDDPLYTHTAEGPDDMPAHLRSALTNTALTLPIKNGSLALGTWQGVYLWEHRHRGHSRRLIVSVLS